MEKFIRFLIRVFLPHHHLSKNPPKKDKSGITIPAVTSKYRLSDPAKKPPDYIVIG